MSKHKVYTEEEIAYALKNKTAEIDRDGELYEADEDCEHVIRCASGGGVECMRCGGWCCY